MERETLLNWLPDEAQGFIDRLAHREDDENDTSSGRIAIVGLSGTGKKTLCNSLWGWQAVADSAEMIRSFGLFLLIDLPTDIYDASNVLFRLERAELVLYVLDGSRELQSADFEWIARLRSLNATLLVVANKTDALSKAALKRTLTALEERLARPVIPVVGSDPKAVREQLIPAILNACPTLAEPLAAEIASLRRKVARQLMLRSAMTSMALSFEDSPPDAHVLLALQMRLIRRIAALYGFKDRGQQVREFLLGLILRVLLRSLGAVSARFPKVREWMVSGTVAAVTTLLIGRLALAYYSAELPVWLTRTVLFSRGG